MAVPVIPRAISLGAIQVVNAEAIEIGGIVETHPATRGPCIARCQCFSERKGRKTQEKFDIYCRHFDRGQGTGKRIYGLTLRVIYSHVYVKIKTVLVV